MNETILITNKEYIGMIDLIDAQRMLIQKYKNYIEVLELVKNINPVVR